MVRGHRKQVFPAACVIEKDVKFNIMLFRTLCSIEVQGSCSIKLNLSQSENCISGIYGQYSFCRCLIGVSLDVRGDKKQVFSAACVIEKDVKFNIMLFRTLCSIEVQGYCSIKLNLSQSEHFISGIYGQCAFCRCLIGASLDVRGDKKQVFSAACVIEKDANVNIIPFRTLRSIEFQGPCSRNLKLITV